MEDIKKSSSKPITVRLPPKLHKRLTFVSERYGISRAAIVRSALVDYMRSQGRR